MAESNRRDFFRLAATEAVRGAREVIPLVDPLVGLVEPKSEPAAEAPPASEETAQPTPRTAALPSHSASVEEMLAISAELGLDSRAEDLRRLAVSSVRLAPEEGGGGSSFAGGEPKVPAAVEIPTFEDGTARFVALLDLPESGRLWIFRAEDGSGDTGPTEATDPATSGVAAVLEPAGDNPSGDPVARPPDAMPLGASPELTLPRPWSPAVEKLGLSTAEQDSWQKLRSRLAEVQGVPLGESAPPDEAIHRLGGFPDERRGDMPLTCELRLLGVDLEGKPPATHPLAGALEGETGGWRLLAQLAADDDLGWAWGPRDQRAYVWGHLESQASGRFDSVQVVVQ